MTEIGQIVDYGAFEAISFDCYGTLIDWESGLLAAFAPVLAAHGATPDPEDLLARYADHEAAAEAGPYRTYREVLAESMRAVCAELAVDPADEEVAAFAGSVGDWPAFPDTPSALSSLAEHYRLAVITNCDDDLFEASRQRLGVAFDVVVTAQQVQAYKPDTRGFEEAFERLGLPPARILHVAQSLFHDHVPARRLGLRSIWIDRRAGRAGSGATPPAQAEPDARFTDLASFAAAATGA